MKMSENENNNRPLDAEDLTQEQIEGVSGGAGVNPAAFNTSAINGVKINASAINEVKFNAPAINRCKFNATKIEK